jgi:hypothetical protein
MNDNHIKIKENLTFYRRMANTNIEIMKKYKSAVVNKMNYKNILNMYNQHNLNFEADIERLKLFLSQTTKNSSEPTEISTENSDCSEPVDVNSETYLEKYENQSNIYTNIFDKIVNKDICYNDYYQKIMKNVSEYKNIIVSNKNYLIPVLFPILISSIMYARRSQK